MVVKGKWYGVNMNFKFQCDMSFFFFLVCVIDGDVSFHDYRCSYQFFRVGTVCGTWSHEMSRVLCMRSE